ncbi:META domain-containing protein [Silvibacterium acidisoli]|uniref:META domain-containing protein n=1 Tax=Acidobacteriaceae bacterium ZG23-2 TaxID=2883246 RepID=UPI00406CBC39
MSIIRTTCVVGAGFLLTASAWAVPANYLAGEPTASGGSELSDTAWKLVRFLPQKSHPVAPEDHALYTIVFKADGQASIRIDCNRGMAEWYNNGGANLSFGPLATTRAICTCTPPLFRLNDDLAKVKFYHVQSKHLFLELVDKTGTYEFEPAANPPA